MDEPRTSLSGQAVVIGLGLNSKATATEVLALVAEALADIGRTSHDIAVVATTERRRSHPAIADLGLELVFIPAHEFEGRVVCERAAAVVLPHGVVVVPKRCSANVCVCVLAPAPACPSIAIP